MERRTDSFATLALLLLIAVTACKAQDAEPAPATGELAAYTDEAMSALLRGERKAAALQYSRLGETVDARETTDAETVEAVLLDGELATDLWAERWRNVGVKTYLKLQDPKVKNPDLWRRLALKGFFMGCDGVVLPSVAGDSLAAAAMRDSLTDIALLSQVLRLSHRLMLCEKDFKVKLEGRMGCFWVDHLGGDQTDDVPLLRLEALARLVRLQAFVDTWCK